MEQFLMNNSIVVMKMIMIWQDFKKICIYMFTLLFLFGNSITWKILIIIHALFDILKPCMILLP